MGEGVTSLMEQVAAAVAAVTPCSCSAQRARADAAEAALARLIEGVRGLAASIHGDSGWEHSAGCEGEPDCFACIEADLGRLLTEVEGTPTTHRTAPLAAEQGAEAPGGHRDDERPLDRRNGEGAC